MIHILRQVVDVVPAVVGRQGTGGSGQEIADRTGLSAGSVRVNLHRGMKLLRERLGPAEAGHYGYNHE